MLVTVLGPRIKTRNFLPANLLQCSMVSPGRRVFIIPSPICQARTSLRCTSSFFVRIKIFDIELLMLKGARVVGGYCNRHCSSLLCHKRRISGTFMVISRVQFEGTLTQFNIKHTQSRSPTTSSHNVLTRS